MEAFIDDLKDLFIPNNRTANLQQFARRGNFNFYKKYQFQNLSYEIKSFDLFKGKKAKRLKGFLKKNNKKEGYNLQLFDYHDFQEFGTKTTTVIHLHFNENLFPDFSIQPKGLLGKMGNFFSRDTAFSHYPEFAESYSIKVQNIEEFEFLISDEIIDILLDRKEISIEGKQNHLLFYKRFKTIEIEELLPFHKLCQHISELMLHENSNEYV